MPGTSLRWRKAAALLLLLPSLELVLYAGFLPTPFLAFPAGKAAFLGFGLDVVLTPLGVAGIVASIGIYRGRAWGRIAGVLVTVLLLAYHAWFAALQPQQPPAPLELAVALAVPVVCGALILFALARRWVPARPGPAATPSAGRSSPTRRRPIRRHRPRSGRLNRPGGPAPSPPS